MILVTGATGHIGKELLPQLLDAGQPVRILVRDQQKVAHLDRSIERAVGDLERPATLEAAMRGIEQIFLVTLNTQQDVNVLNAARRAGARHIVKLSTLEASNTTMKVGKWHREREELIQASGLDWTFLRPGMFMSNSIEWWSASIKKQGAVYFPGGEGKTAPIDPKDIAAVAARALTEPHHKRKIYELTGPELLRISEMVQTISGVLGTSIQYVDIPPIAAKLWMLKSGMDKDLVNGLMEMLHTLRRNEAAICNNLVEQITGCPARTYKEWCSENIAAFKE